MCENYSKSSIEKESVKAKRKGKIVFIQSCSFRGFYLLIIPSAEQQDRLWMFYISVSGTF